MDKFLIKRPLPNPQNELAFFDFSDFFSDFFYRGHLFSRIGSHPVLQLLAIFMGFRSYYRIYTLLTIILGKDYREKKKHKI